MSSKRQEFWLEKPSAILDDVRLVPHHGMDVTGKINCITRLVTLTALILYLLGFKDSVLFLLLALTIIIIFYYIEKDNMSTSENFSYQTLASVRSRDRMIDRYPYYKIVHDNANAAQQRDMNNALNSSLLCNDEYEGKVDDKMFSRNHALVGKPNPKTLVQPIIANRAYDWKAWRNNDYNNFASHINNRTRQFLSENGYLEQTPDCGGNNTCVSLKYAGPPDFNASPCSPASLPAEHTPKPQKKSMVKEAFSQAMNRSIESYANYDSPIPAEQGSDYIKFNNGNETNIRAGDIDTMCGYRPDNTKYNIPVNYPSSIVERSDDLKEFNRNIWTQHAGEDIYQVNQINEPDNWNIGISFNQQFPPTTLTVDKKGFQFQEHDPRTFKVPHGEVIDPFTMEPKPEDVYDPRQTGYGPNYRSYVDPLTGQPRFYYDDVMAVRRSNYITRNKIDHIPELNQPGVMKPDQDIFKTMAEIRKAANDNFADSMITQRVELQQRLMRKRNSDWAQRKLAPIYGSGGGGRI
jgi:hypothetical protein